MVEICVVNCCFCQTFQGQQVKKEKKWTCKMCGEKQSFKKIFVQGSGKECRQYVQKLNMMKGKGDKQEGKVNKQEEKEEEQLWQKTEQLGQAVDQVNHDDIPVSRKTPDYSKWKQFIGSEKEIQEGGSESDPETSFTTERGIFNKCKAGQKRKKPNMQTALEELRSPRKLQRNNPKCGPSSGHNTMLNKAETAELYLESFNTTDVVNQLPQTHFGCNLKENEIQLQTLSSDCQNKTIACRQTKASKWSKYT